MTRWIVPLLAPTVLLLAVACGEPAEPPLTATLQAEATDTPAPEPTLTAAPSDPTATLLPPEPTAALVPQEPTEPPPQQPPPQQQEPPSQQQEPPPPTDTPVPPSPTSTPAPQTSCHPSYQGACLDPNAIDYDCAGGSGNGPLYTGPVIVVGPDVFDLDRDNDGMGCE